MYKSAPKSRHCMSDFTMSAFKGSREQALISHLFLVGVGNSWTPSDPFAVASFVCGAPAFLSAI